MKRIQSVLCAAALAFALSTTTFAGNIHGVTATASGNIHGVTATSTTDFLAYAAGILISSIFGNIHG